MNPMLIAQLVLMIGVFYFLIIMPKNKKIKLEKEFLTNLKTGDKIITIAGIHGKVSEIAETTIVMYKVYFVFLNLFQNLFFFFYYFLF